MVHNVLFSFNVYLYPKQIQGAHYCSKNGCGLHCERHKRECFFNKVWKDSDLCRFSVYERPTDKMLFLLHAVFNGGLIFTEAELPLVPIKSTPLQIHVNELCDQLGDVDPKVAAQNSEYAQYVADFLHKNGGLKQMSYKDAVRELIKLLRFYDTNSIQIVDNIATRPIAKGLYLSISLFNHSCSPNCMITFEGDCATVRTLRHIQEGEELVVSYIDTALPFDVRQAQLKKQWCFQCKCVKCESFIEKSNESLLHGIFCPNEDCRAQLLPVDASLEQDQDDPKMNDKKTSSCSEDGDDLYRPNPLSVSTVPYLNQSFLPSIAGYLGERSGYEYCEGPHGLGYYQVLDKYGYPIQERGDSVGIHQCKGCQRQGVDVYLQKLLLLTCERHKYFHTHKQSVYDQRIAAFETALQLEQVITCFVIFELHTFIYLYDLTSIFAFKLVNKYCC
jgi:hypothetical protein